MRIPSVAAFRLGDNLERLLARRGRERVRGSWSRSKGI